MKKITMVLILLMTLNTESLASLGQPGLALSTSYWTWIVESENSVFNANRNSVSTSIMVSKLNYALPSGIFFGATMFSSKDSDSNNKLFGPNVGFNYENFSIGLSYFLDPKEKSNQNLEYTDGQFLSLELGYHINVTRYFVIGATLTYLKRNYKKAILNGNEIDATVKSDQYYPLVSFGFIFDPMSDSYYDEYSY